MVEYEEIRDNWPLGGGVQTGGDFTSTWSQPMAPWTSAAEYEEARDKRPFGRDPDRSCSHLQISVTLFRSQPMATWTSAAAYEYSAADIHAAMGSDQKNLYTHVKVTPDPVRVPTHRPLVPSFTSVVSYARTFRRALVHVLAHWGVVACYYRYLAISHVMSINGAYIRWRAPHLHQHVTLTGSVIYREVIRKQCKLISLAC